MAFRNTGTNSVFIQQRDLAVFRDLAELPAMALEHCAEFHFEGRLEAARIRIRALAAAGFVKRSEGETTRSLIFKTPTGNALLGRNCRAAKLERHITGGTLEHGLQVLDIKAALYRASRLAGRGFVVSEFGTSPEFYQFVSARSLTCVFPDGFIRLKAEPGIEFSFFIELDRSTETAGTLAAKAREYLAFYQSGGFARRNGAPGYHYRQHPFRLLVVVQSEERRNNLAAALSRLPRPILTLAWLATLDDVRRDPVGSIWLTPAAYRQAVRGTRFAEPPSSRPYRTDPTREQLVAERAALRRLLE